MGQTVFYNYRNINSFQDNVRSVVCSSFVSQYLIAGDLTEKIQGSRSLHSSLWFFRVVLSSGLCRMSVISLKFYFADE